MIDLFQYIAKVFIKFQEPKDNGDAGNLKDKPLDKQKARSDISN